MEQMERLYSKTKLKGILLLNLLLGNVKYMFFQTVNFSSQYSQKFALMTHILKFLNWWNVKPKTIKKITISSKPSPEQKATNSNCTNEDFSSTFFAILHQISKNDTMSAKILALNHIYLRDYEYHIDQCNCCDECKLAHEERSGRTERFKRAMMILRQRNPFKMSKSIDCIIR